MNVKKFLVSGIAGGIINFLLGWIYYGILFKNTFPSNGNENISFIFLGALLLDYSQPIFLQNGQGFQIG